MKRINTLILSLALAVAGTSAAHAVDKENFVGQRYSGQEVKTLTEAQIQNINVNTSTQDAGIMPLAGSTGAVAQMIWEDFSAMPEEQLNSPMKFPQYATCKWLEGKNLYSFDTSCIMYGSRSSEISLPNVDATEPMYIWAMYCSQSGNAEALKVTVKDDSGSVVYTGRIGDGYIPASGLYGLGLAIPAQGNVTNGTITISSYRPTGVIGIYKLEIDAAMRQSSVKLGEPSDFATNVVDDRNFTTSFSAASNATSYQVEVSNKITTRRQLTDFTVWSSSVDKISDVSNNPGYPTKLAVCISDTKMPEMPKATLHWPVFVNGAIGFTAMPYRTNQIPSYAGFETEDIDCSALSKGGKINVFFDAFPVNLIGEEAQITMHLEIYSK